MANLSAPALIQEIHDAIKLGDGRLIEEDIQQKPFKFLLEFLNESHSIWIYIWNLTEGGRNLKGEYRIQITGVKTPLPLNPNGKTLILGFNSKEKIFAGFDILRHYKSTSKSPSVQISDETLRLAQVKGINYFKKINDDVVIGIRPDYFLNYLINADYFHKLTDFTEIDDLLGESTLFSPDTNIIDSSERKRIIHTISRLERRHDFRKNVLDAYDHKCAITGLQLGLLDAAHIIPVNMPGSTDDVSNGLSLSPTFHRAYDDKIIYIDEKYHLQLNQSLVDKFINMKLDNGLSYLKQFQGKNIALPSDPKSRPLIKSFLKANHLRGIPGY